MAIMGFHSIAQVSSEGNTGGGDVRKTADVVGRYNPFV